MSNEMGGRLAAAPHLLAWAAGFIDGEGTVTIVKETGKNQHGPITRHRVLLSCSQANTRRPLDILAELFGGTVQLQKRPTRVGNPVWTWRVYGGSSVRPALEALLPHLVVKRERAELVLDFARTIRPKNNNHAPLTVDELRRRSDVEQRLGLLHHKGRPRGLRAV